MSAYEVTKLLIKYNRKPKEEILEYCNAYLKAEMITQTEYDDLVSQLQ